MTRRIKALSSLMINQIAAGEVIERPASVVKELVENALDAHARSIYIHVDGAGIERIQIRDDGAGIHKQDLHLALESHATSKVTSEKDIHAITSLGFRGEALASIRSISRMMVLSKQKECAEAWMIKASGQEISQLEPTSHPDGTTIHVMDLFYNTPVRKKFLKSDKTETQAIDTVIKRLALSHFQVRFQVHYQKRKLYDLMPANTQAQQDRRIEKLLGENFLKHSMRIEMHASDVKLWGWVGSTALERKQSDWQYFFINNRYVRDKLLNHAVTQAYHGYMDESFKPAYVLFLEVDHRAVDVNVHPMKSEVRFEQPRYIHDFVCNAVQKVLATPELFTTEHFNPIQKQPDTHSQMASENLTKKNRSGLKSLSYKFIGTLHQRYRIIEVPSGMWIVDMDLVRRHVDYLEYTSSLEKNSLTVFPLVIPETISFTVDESDKVIKYLPILEKLGLSLNQLDTLTFVLRKAPKVFAHQNFNDFFTNLVSSISLQDDLLTILKKSLNLIKYPSRLEVEDDAYFQRWLTFNTPVTSYDGQRIYDVYPMQVKAIESVHV